MALSGCSLSFNEDVTKQPDEPKNQTASRNMIPKNLHIVSIGDSLTRGIGDSTNQGGYIPYLQKDLENLNEVNRVQIENFGVRGNRTDQLLDRLEKKEVRNALKKSDFVVITIGGNDVMKVFRENIAKLEVEVFEKERTAYEERLNKILSTVRKINSEAGIILIGLYNPFEKWFSNIEEVDDIIADWNQASRNILNQYERSQFVMIADIFQDQEENLLYKDHFHPNDEGYKLIADRVFHSIKGKKLVDLVTKN